MTVLNKFKLVENRPRKIKHDEISAVNQKFNDKNCKFYPENDETPQKINLSDFF